MSRAIAIRPWRRLASAMRPALIAERRTIAIAGAALLAEVGLRALEPWPLKLIFDHLVSGAALTATRWHPALATSQLAAVSALALLALVSLRALSGYIQTVALALSANRVLTSLRAALYRRLQLLPLSFHATARAGDLTVRLTGDVGMLQDVALTAALPLLADGFMLLGMLGLMLFLQPGLTLLVLVPLPLFVFRWRRTHRSIREASRQQRTREGALAAAVAEAFSAIKTVQALSLETTLGRTFTTQNTKSADQGVRAKRLSAALERSVDLLIAISTGILLWRGTLLVVGGAMSPGELLVFVSYLKAGFKPLQSFAKYTSRLGKATAAAERVVEVLDHAPEIADRAHAIVAPAYRGNVIFDRVGFHYSDQRTVLRDASFTIETGEFVAIVGQSGAGKSTLSNLLLRLYEPTSGRVLIDGIDVQDVTIASLRSQIGVVLQDTILFAGSIRDNLALGVDAVDDSAIDAALRVANAFEFVHAMPGGLDASVGERGVTLSNGQRQRLAIARAVLRATPILLLDEPTVGLDDENEAVVCDAILRMTKGRTTFLITHALHLAARADRVLVLVDGSIAENGSPSELLAAGGAFAALYGERTARTPNGAAPLRRSHVFAG